MTYNIETWTLTNQAKNKLTVTENKDGKKYVKRHISRQENKHLGKTQGKRHRYNWRNLKTEVSGTEQGTYPLGLLEYNNWKLP